MLEQVFDIETPERVVLLDHSQVDLSMKVKDTRTHNVRSE